MDNKDRDKIKEPYTPENTPNPPQVMDPNLRNERGETAGTNDKKRAAPAEREEKKESSGKKLGDQTEITDETTI
jgi:hypothetical protein